MSDTLFHFSQQITKYFSAEDRCKRKIHIILLHLRPELQLSDLMACSDLSENEVNNLAQRSHKRSE